MAAGKTVGLFAGIGGIELGLDAAGFETQLLCEIEPAAQAVLRERFDGVNLRGDVTKLRSLPRDCEVLAAGFPCQDLSQAGRLAGIGGKRSGLVDHVLKFLGKSRRNRPTWLLLENVPFMLQLDKGEAMRFLTSELDDLGYRWAYRVVDARSFGVPQRRRRVILLASRDEDPRPVLLADDEGTEPSAPGHEGKACGFYWTEGNTGLGWAVDAVPTIKGGSGLGIPSPPAIWMPDGSIVTPDIRDAERLQGFAPDWTLPASLVDKRRGARWKLVGNAVCVPMAKWIGERLVDDVGSDVAPGPRLGEKPSWPRAAWGDSSGSFGATVGEFPVATGLPSLTEFLEHPPHPLSERATRGFRDRLFASNLSRPDAFSDALDAAVSSMERARESNLSEALAGSDL